MFSRYKMCFCWLYFLIDDFIIMNFPNRIKRTQKKTDSCKLIRVYEPHLSYLVSVKLIEINRLQWEIFIRFCRSISFYDAIEFVLSFHTFDLSTEKMGENLFPCLDNFMSFHNILKTKRSGETYTRTHISFRRRSKQLILMWQ